MAETGKPSAPEDLDPDEIKEWLESFEDVFKRYGREGAALFLTVFIIIFFVGTDGFVNSLVNGVMIGTLPPDLQELAQQPSSGGLTKSHVDLALGTVGLADDVDSFIEAKHLGPDALSLDLDTFRQALEGKRGTIKSFLMNQKYLAGIGNVYSDEVLFQSKEKDFFLIFKKMIKSS